MAGTFGSRAKNQFPLPSIESGETYYPLVNSETGEITLKRINKLVPDSPIPGFSEGLDATVGTIPTSGPNKGKFIPGGGATPTEIEGFAQQPQAVLVVRNQAVTAAQRGGAANAQQLIFPDTASPQPDPLTPGSIQTNDIPDLGASRDIDESLAKADFVYPTSMRTSQQDRIKFTALSITGRAGVRSGRTEEGGVGNFSLGTRETMMLGSVTLPIQPSITDSNGVDWGGANLDPITAYAAAKSLDVAASDNITAAAARALNEAADTFKRELKDGLGKAIAISFAGQAVGAQGLLSRTSGAIVNPNLELLFNGPTLRPFNFTFRLSPRSKEEAKEVKGIINFFKKAMAVKKAESQIFLKAPNIFKIQYFTGNGSEDHKSLNKIKDCALLGCDVDYTPDGSYMTFNDEEKTITSYQLTLRFSELDPIYNTDYADGHPIGY